MRVLILVGTHGAKQHVSAYLPLAAFYDDELLLRGGSGKDDLSVVLQNIVHRPLIEVFQVGAVDHTGLGVPARRRGRQKTL